MWFYLEIWPCDLENNSIQASHPECDIRVKWPACEYGLMCKQNRKIWPQSTETGGKTVETLNCTGKRTLLMLEQRRGRSRRRVIETVVSG